MRSWQARLSLIVALGAILGFAATGAESRDEAGTMTPNWERTFDDGTVARVVARHRERRGRCIEISLATAGQREPFRASTCVARRTPSQPGGLILSHCAAGATAIGGLAPASVQIRIDPATGPARAVAMLRPNVLGGITAFADAFERRDLPARLEILNARGQRILRTDVDRPGSACRPSGGARQRAMEVGSL